MRNERLYCPYVMQEDNRCSIYENWVEQTDDRRLDVIFKEGEKYSCLAITALKDPITEGGISFNDELKNRIEDTGTNIQRVDCMNIRLLNELKKLEDWCQNSGMNLLKSRLVE